MISSGLGPYIQLNLGLGSVLLLSSFGEGFLVVGGPIKNTLVSLNFSSLIFYFASPLPQYGTRHRYAFGVFRMSVSQFSTSFIWFSKLVSLFIGTDSYLLNLIFGILYTIVAKSAIWRYVFGVFINAGFFVLMFVMTASQCSTSFIWYSKHVSLFIGTDSHLLH